jgi:anti-sigma B factor antagonist
MAKAAVCRSSRSTPFYSIQASEGRGPVPIRNRRPSSNVRRSRRSLHDTSTVARGSCFCSAVPRGEAPFFNMAFTFRYYDVRMPQEPLHIEDVSGTPSGQRMLRLRGPIVLANFFEFQSLVRGNTSRHLILDLTGVPYIDSAGIGALVGAYVNHQKDGRSLALVGVTQRVRDAMEVTRVEQFFHFHDTVESAQGTPGKP